jgi:hypothetical protein
MWDAYPRLHTRACPRFSSSALAPRDTTSLGLFFFKKFQKMVIKKIKKYSNFLFCETRYSVLDDVLPTDKIFSKLSKQTLLIVRAFYFTLQRQNFG